MSASRGIRETQRRETERRTLEAARELFAQRGYAATSVRAIAERAQVDAALVVRNFESKAQLYERAVGLAPDTDELDPSHLAESLTASLRTKLEARPTELLAGLRSALGHPDAARALADVMRAEQSSVAMSLAGGHAQQRAGLIGALTIGVVVARYILELDGLEDDSDVLHLLSGIIDRLVENDT
jgi:AcrR family transcriptional regulator